jgi:LL-diaminopimelate aminotransferase
MESRNQMFKERRNVVVGGLRDIGLEVESPLATFYVWSTIPKGDTSQEFCFKVLEGLLQIEWVNFDEKWELSIGR